MRLGRSPRFSPGVHWINADLRVFGFMHVGRAAAVMLHPLLTGIALTIYPIAVRAPAQVRYVKFSIVMFSMVKFDPAEGTKADSLFERKEITNPRGGRLISLSCRPTTGMNQTKLLFALGKPFTQLPVFRYECFQLLPLRYEAVVNLQFLFPLRLSQTRLTPVGLHRRRSLRQFGLG